MTTAAPAKTVTRELARRVGNGLEVTLLWHGGDELTVLVYDARSENGFEIAVEPARALDAFYHPFSFAASQRDALALAA